MDIHAIGYMDIHARIFQNPFTEEHSPVKEHSSVKGFSIKGFSF